MDHPKLTSSATSYITATGFALLVQIDHAFANQTSYFPINSPNTLVYIGLVGGLVGIAIMIAVIWKLLQNKGTGRQDSNQFDNIESSSLDSNPALCIQFYTMAFNYRAEHDQKKYQTNIIKHHKFVYGFHNKALQLIDDLFTKTHAFKPSCQFVLATIKSGHIGEVFTDINYERGISGLHISPHTPVIAYSNTDSIDLWTSNSSQPICVLNKKQLELKRPNKTDGYVSATLLAETRSTYQKIQIELGFPDIHFDVNHNEIRQHDIIATQNYHKFEDWLKKRTPKPAKLELSNFGIAVEEHSYDTEYGIPAPELSPSKQTQASFLSQALQMLKSTKVDAFFTRYDMPIVKQKSAMDALVLCSGLGLVVITEQHTTGQVFYNGDAGWMVQENNRSQIVENVCIQAERAKKSLRKFLRLNKLESWPVFSLVVFSANDIELNLKPGNTRIQCDVVRLSELEQWFNANSTTNDTRFTKDDYNKLALLLGNKQRQSSPRLKEA